MLFSFWMLDVWYFGWLCCEHGWIHMQAIGEI